MPDVPRTSRLAPYRVSVAIILVAGAIAAVAFYRDARRDEDEHARLDFERRAAGRHALTREVLQRYSESLHGLSAIFAINSEITRDEFALATAQLQPRLSGVLAFEWAPYVSRSRRAAVELAYQRMYEPRRFEFIEFDEEGRARRAAERPHHFPICLLEPMAGNEIVLGYDLVTAPTALFLERARKARVLTVSHAFRLRQERENRLGFVIILPVFRPAPAGLPRPNAVPDDMPDGYLQFVFHVREFLRRACTTQPEPLIDMLFVDGSETNPAGRMLHFQPSSPDVAEPASEADFRRSSPFLHELALPFGERDWRVLYRPRGDWIDAQRSSQPFWRGATIMALSGLVAMIVRIAARRTEVIQREVVERTAELADSRRQFANLVHALPGMAYQARYPGKLVPVFVSDGAISLTGWAPQDFVSGKIHPRDLVHPEDVERVRMETTSALEARRDIESTYRLRTRDGSVKWVLARGRGVYDAEGRLDLVEGIVIDISEQKRAEEARLAIERKLLETQKLESLGLLAGGIAHDFNNLLSAILGNASLTRLTLDATHAADPHLRAIETAALRAAELCRQMLAYAGKGRFIVERINVASLVEDLLPLLRVSIGRNINLELKLTREIPGVKADATQLRQIVMNLVLNAVDALANRRDGIISLETRMIEVDRELLQRCVTGQTLPTGPYIEVAVRDNGCGMPADVLAKIFDPFYTTKFAGRGLGLAAVLGIVRSHNGALLVTSEPDRGTEFRLFLPTIPGERIAEPEEKAGTNTPWRQAGAVLLIEDEEPVRLVMQQLLQSFGYEVHAVTDGRTGVDAFREKADQWQVVVVDLIMPGLSGDETVSAIQAIKPDVRVLLISGFADAEDPGRPRHQGRVAFLSKPFRRDAFQAKLKELFR